MISYNNTEKDIQKLTLFIIFQSNTTPVLETKTKTLNSNFFADLSDPAIQRKLETILILLLKFIVPDKYLKLVKKSKQLFNPSN